VGVKSLGHLPRKEIPVRTHSDGFPEALYLEGRWRSVAEVADSWRDVGCWWSGEREKVFFRLHMVPGGFVEVYREINGAGPWVLYRIYD